MELNLTNGIIVTFDDKKVKDWKWSDDGKSVFIKYEFCHMIYTYQYVIGHPFFILCCVQDA